MPVEVDPNETLKIEPHLTVEQIVRVHHAGHRPPPTRPGNRELDKLDDVVAAGFVRHCQATPQLEINSIDDFKAFLRADAAAFPDNIQTITHLAADGDLIGIFATYEGTHLGRLGPFEPTGKHAKFDFAGMFKVEGTS